MLKYITAAGKIAVKIDCLRFPSVAKYDRKFHNIPTQIHLYTHKNPLCGDKSLCIL